MGYTHGVKWTYKLAKDYVENLGYILISKEFKSASKKLILMDYDGYYYIATITALLDGDKPDKFSMFNPYTIDNINLWCWINKKPFRLFSKVYENSKKHLEWQCLKEECGEIFTDSWNHISRGRNCSYCSGRRVGKSNCLATVNPKLASEWHPTLNGDLTPYDVVSHSTKKIWWQCSNNENHIWKVTVYSRTNGNGCKYCDNRIATEDYNLLVCSPEIASEWNYFFNDKLPQDYCPVSGQKVWWKCNECGNEWETAINDRHSGCGCPECSSTKSNGEKRVKIFLENNNITFKPQKKFKGLLGLGGGNLSYDFYLPQYNTLIECQGEQHKKLKKRFHKTQADFEKQLEHDKRKRIYALDNNIRFLEIWFFDYKNIETTLKEYINNFKE